MPENYHAVNQPQRVSLIISMQHARMSSLSLLSNSLIKPEINSKNILLESNQHINKWNFLCVILFDVIIVGQRGVLFVAYNETLCRRCGMQIFLCIVFVHQDRRTEVIWAQHALFTTWPFEDAERTLLLSWRRIDMTVCTWIIWQTFRTSSSG